MLELTSVPVVIRPKRQLIDEWKVENTQKIEAVYSCEYADELNMAITTTGFSMYYFPDGRFLGIDVVIQRIAEPWYFCEALESGFKIKARRSELQWSPSRKPLSE